MRRARKIWHWGFFSLSKSADIILSFEFFSLNLLKILAQYCKIY